MREKGAIHVLLIFMVLIGLAVSLVYLLRNSTSFNRGESSPKPNHVQTEVIPTPVNEFRNDTASWKTYSSKDIGFSFNYPPNSKIKESFYETGNKEQTGLVLTYCDKSSLDSAECDDNLQLNRMSIEFVSFNPDDPSAMIPSCLKRQDIEINNKIWSQFKGYLPSKTCSDGVSWDYNYQLTYTKVKNMYIKVSSDTSSGAVRNYSKIFDQIISTFKLTD